MAVRCTACDRLSRDETLCEWCREEIPVEARQLAAARVGARDDGGNEAVAVLTDDDRSGRIEREASGGATGGRAAAPGLAGQPTADARSEAVEAVSRGEARAAAAAVPAEEREADEAAAAVDASAEIEAIERRQERDTMVILALIIVQFALTLYLGRLSSWWTVTGVLWLLVGYGVRERAQWALALPLVLFTLDVAFVLFGLGPREVAGFPAFAPLDFFLYFFRLVIWGLIWRLRDELA